MLPSNDSDAITIGFFGSNGKTSTINLLRGIFNQSGLATVVISDEKNVPDEGSMTNIGFNKVLNKLDKSGIILVEIGENFLKNFNKGIFDFDILIHCHICDDSFEDSSEGVDRINAVINSFNSTKTIILNTDDLNWKRLIIDMEDSYLITYGFGNKATVTASSIECSTEIQFAYCLQRTLLNFKNQKIEPMEIPVRIKTPGCYNLYNCLSAITAALLCGVGVGTIVDYLNNTTDFDSSFRVLHGNGFSVISGICKNILSFEAFFEAVQNLPYGDAYLIFEFDNNAGWQTYKKILEVIFVWTVVLKIRGVYFIDDGGMFINSIYFNSFLENMNNTGVKLEQLGGGLSNMDRVLEILNKNDMLLIPCSRDTTLTRGKIEEALAKLT